MHLYIHIYIYASYMQTYAVYTHMLKYAKHM